MVEKMRRFIDIHSHILPGVDDGAENRTICIEMLREAYECGTQDIILTPHYHPGKKYTDLQRQREKFIGLKQYLENDSEVRVHDGNEIYYTHQTIDLLNCKQLSPLAESRYCLLEFPVAIEYPAIENAVRALSMDGYWSVIAHAERYRCLRNLKNIEELIKRGAYIQINASSVGRSFDVKNSHYIKQLLENELIHFIASDAHDLKERTPNMSRCYEWLNKHYGSEYTDQLMYENALYILQKERL